MLYKRIEEVENPIVYIFLTLMVSCICYGFNENFKELSIFIVSFFFISIFYYCGIRFSSIMIIFFVVGILINVSYYKIPTTINNDIRIIKIDKYNIVANYRGKNIILKTNIKNLKTGEKYRIFGQTQNIQDKSKGITGEVKVIKINKIDGDFITDLYKSKYKIYSLLEENLGQRKAGLISSIAFGYSENLDIEDKNDMKNFGIIHSISVSGLHVAIIYALLKNFIGSIFSIILVLIYVIFTGGEYSSIRAFLMLVSIEGGHILKRNNNSISALCLSAIILLIFKPYSIFEISFDLSYLATIGIILFNKKINYYMYKFPTRLRNSLSLTLSAQIFTIPYLILIFKDFSINFIIGNLLLMPFLDIMVITGNALLVTYMYHPLFDFVSYINLKIIQVFDWILDILYNFALPTFYGNEYVVSFYMFLLISFYFVKKGYKKYIYLPAIFIFVLAIQLYSPIPSIKYYREGAISVSYKGQRIIISNKANTDLKRLSNIAYANQSYKETNLIDIIGVCKIKSIGKNYLLDTYKKKYILKMITNKTDNNEYDIINFKDGKSKRILIIKGVAFLCYF